MRAFLIAEQLITKAHASR